jgi:hypothetical protein
VTAIRIVVQMPTPSLNETQRMHHFAYARLGKKWQMALALLALVQRATKATGKRRLVIERRAKRELDKDNAYGGAKLVIDALKKLGLILDDDAANLDLEVTQAKCGKGEKPCTILTLEDVCTVQLLHSKGDL